MFHVKHNVIIIMVAGTADLIVGAEGDVGALAVDVGDDGAGVGIESELCAGIADVSHDLADDLLEIDIAVGGDLAHDVDKTGRCAGLAGHAGIGVVGQDLLQLYYSTSIIMLHNEARKLLIKA